MPQKTTFKPNLSEYSPVHWGKSIIAIYAVILMGVIGSIKLIYNLLQIMTEYYPGWYIKNIEQVVYISIFIVFSLKEVRVRFRSTEYPNMIEFLKDYYYRNIRGYWVEYYLVEYYLNEENGIFRHVYPNLNSLINRENYSILIPLGGWIKRYHIVHKGRVLDNAILKIKRSSDRDGWGGNKIIFYDIHGDKVGLDIIEALKFLDT